MQIEYKDKVYNLGDFCGYCPEQYNIDCNRSRVGAARLTRDGYFIVEALDPLNNIIFILYRKHIEGSYGKFNSDEQRLKYLTKAVKKIHKCVINSKQ